MYFRSTAIWVLFYCSIYNDAFYDVLFSFFWEIFANFLGKSSLQVTWFLVISSIFNATLKRKSRFSSMILYIVAEDTPIFLAKAETGIPISSRYSCNFIHSSFNLFYICEKH